MSLKLKALAWAMYLRDVMKIQQVCWDFDGTITTTYNFIRGIPCKPNSKPNWKELAKQISPDFIAMYKACQFLGLKQTIVTHNELIGDILFRQLLGQVFDNETTMMMSFVCKHTKDKQYHLDLVNQSLDYQDVASKRIQTILIDDLQYNIITASKNGYSTWQVKNPSACHGTNALTNLGFKLPDIDSIVIL